MTYRPFLIYWIARRSAAELDRQGRRPGVVMRALGAITGLAVLGLGACIAVFFGAVALHAIGIG